jgi:hypothetical protein
VTVRKQRGEPAEGAGEKIHPSKACPTFHSVFYHLPTVYANFESINGSMKAEPS